MKPYNHATDSFFLKPCVPQARNRDWHSPHNSWVQTLENILIWKLENLKTPSPPSKKNLTSKIKKKRDSSIIWELKRATFSLLVCVYSLLSKLSRSKATGPDNISAKLLKKCPDLIGESLSLIFNQSLRTGIFPNEWKNARVTPLYKNPGKRNYPSNYCPIYFYIIIVLILILITDFAERNNRV